MIVDHTIEDFYDFNVGADFKKWMSQLSIGNNIEIMRLRL